MNPSGLLSVEQALAHLQARYQPVTAVRSCPVAEALHHVLAEDVVSAMAVPPHANSAMDGYGYRHGTGSADGTHILVGTVAAGHPLDGRVMDGQAVRILTGAPIPDGVDSVAMQEDCRLQDGQVVIPPHLKAGSHIRPRGDDVAEGQVVLRAGQVLRPQDVGMASAIGLTHLPVRQAVRVAVFSTGDEIHAPGQPLPPGGIYDTNRTTAMGLLQSLGCQVTDMGILPDDRALIAATLGEAAQHHDLIVTSGGVSVGDEDHVKAAVQQQGTLDFWKLAIKPGKPLALGQIGQAVFLGLPGNPVAVMVAFMLVGRPLVRRLMGAMDVPPLRLPVRADVSLTRKAGRREWLRARLRLQDGALWASVYPSDGSGVLSSMVWSDGLLEIPEDCTAITPGDSLFYIPYSELLQ